MKKLILLLTVLISFSSFASEDKGDFKINPNGVAYVSSVENAGDDSYFILTMTAFYFTDFTECNVDYGDRFKGGEVVKKLNGKYVRFSAECGTNNVVTFSPVTQAGSDFTLEQIKDGFLLYGTHLFTPSNLKETLAELRKMETDAI